jgi:glyoxylase-like metal-dependent hydrolase (beta-lactamase superfamily II)
VRITRLSAHLTQLAKWPAAFPMNCYLVEEEDGLTLVDSTIFSPAGDVAVLVKQLGKQLRRVALTHAHGDHVGGVSGVRKLYPSVEILISERDGRILAGDKTLLSTEPQTPVKGSFVKIDWKPDRLLKAGDRVGSLEVVASPGHTPGHVAFLDVRDKALIAGDAFQTRGGIAVSGDLRLLFPFVAMATWNKPAALTSALALRSLEPSLLAVGHGEAIKEPGPAIDRAIESARRAFA